MNPFHSDSLRTRRSLLGAIAGAIPAATLLASPPVADRVPRLFDVGGGASEAKVPVE